MEQARNLPLRPLRHRFYPWDSKQVAFPTDPEHAHLEYRASEEFVAVETTEESWLLTAEHLLSYGSCKEQENIEKGYRQIIHIYRCQALNRTAQQGTHER